MQLKKTHFLLKMYNKAKSLKAVQRAYQAIIQMQERTVSTFEKHGSVVGTTKTRKKVKKQLKTMIAENHSLSTRKAASVLQHSQTLIVSVLHDDLHLKPYKFHNRLINI